MRVFILAFAGAIVLGVATGVVLNKIQEPVSEAFATAETRVTQ